MGRALLPVSKFSLVFELFQLFALLEYFGCSLETSESLGYTLDLYGSNISNGVYFTYRIQANI